MSVLASGSSIACSDEATVPAEPDSKVQTNAPLTVCPTANVVANPPQFYWMHHAATATTEAYESGVLEFGEATFTIGGQTLTTRAYRQQGRAYSIPGPTIRMKPGRKYVLSFHNTLPYEPLSSAENTFKDNNTTNLHTHGLHISPESPSDDVMRYFEGGTGGDFVFKIPSRHMGGTHWYHAHHHGSTFLQVSGGAFGLIQIDDARDGIPANVTAMTDRLLVIAYLDPTAASKTSDTLMSGSLSPTWTVNGVVQGNLCAPAGEWQHWRVLIADRDATDKTIGVGANCEVALLARDGVWRTTAPKILSTNSLALTGASRADLAVRCSDDSTITVNGSSVAKILVSGTGNTVVGPYSNGSTGATWSAVRPGYLRDLRNVSSAQLNLAKVQMSARSINGSKFDPNIATFTFDANKVQDWAVDASAHPFHLHVYPFQAQNCSGSFENGEYYDTLSTACSVRFDLNAATASVFDGRTMLHCHILEHEDQGAMGWMDVVGGTAPPTFPAGTTYSEYYPL